MIQSVTSNGTAVALTGVENSCGRPAVRVEFDHPAAGKVCFTSESYGTMQDRAGILGGWSAPGGKYQQVCVTVPRGDFDAAMAEARAIGEREIEAIRSGAQKITLHYHDGEYLSGHTVHGRAAKLLVGLGVAEEVSGWGVHVGHKLVEAIGEEFTFAQAEEFARPALEAKAAKRAEAEAARQAKFDQARQTGKPVELARWMDECCERDFDCSLDILSTYAMPDGSVKTERVHTH